MIVNRSRVRQRGLELNLPVKLTSLEKLPTITSEVRSMLHSHPKVFLEDEKPRCYVSQVGATSFNVAISCNLKPMVSHSLPRLNHSFSLNLNFKKSCHFECFGDLANVGSSCCHA